MYNAVVNDKLRGKNIIVLTGIREQLAIDLVRRFKGLLKDYDWNNREGEAVINACTVRAYPSMRIKDVRGQTSVSHILVDEVDHFQESMDSTQLFGVIEPLIVKSNPQIILCGTPGPINSTLYQLYSQKESECRYHRLYIPITKAVGKNNLISEAEHEKIKMQPYYNQEALLRFGSYGQNSLFSLDTIDYCVQLGKQYADPNHNPIAAKNPYPYVEHRNTEVFALGCDPGWGSSKTGICMLAINWDQKIHVLVCEEHEKADESFIIQRLLQLREKTGRPKDTRIFVDASAPGFIRRLKGAIPDERTDFEDYIDYLRKRKLLRPPQELEIVHYCQVVPVAFSKWGPSLLATLHVLVQERNLVVHPKFTTLISQLQSARNTPNRSNNFVLDKSQGNSFDALDSLRLALFNVDVDAPEVNNEAMEEKEITI